MVHIYTAIDLCSWRATAVCVTPWNWLKIDIRLKYATWLLIMWIFVYALNTQSTRFMERTISVFLFCMARNTVLQFLHFVNPLLQTLFRLHSVLQLPFRNGHVRFDDFFCQWMILKCLRMKSSHKFSKTVDCAWKWLCEMPFQLLSVYLMELSGNQQVFQNISFAIFSRISPSLLNRNCSCLDH